jgi:hypothetical protein
VDNSGFYYLRLELDMKFTPVVPPRAFEVGFGKTIQIKDCAHIELEADEQVTFTTESGAEYDVARKSWGFYATPSLNGRLQRFGLRGVLIKNRISQYFVMLVEKGQEAGFEEYLGIEALQVVCWLDDASALANLERKLTETE